MRIPTLRHGLVLWLVGSALSAAPTAGPGCSAPLAQASIRLSADAALCGLDLYDGRAAARVALQPVPDGWQDSDGRLTVSLHPEDLPDGRRWRVQISNRGPENAWLLLRAYRPFALQPDWLYFNGNFSSHPRDARVRSTIARTMPLVGTYDRQTAVGLGLEPRQVFSYIENGVLPNGPTGAFYYGVKLVVDPGQAATVDFVTFTCPSPWGERSLVAAYQGLFPEAFRPIPGSDSRLQTRGQSGAVSAYSPSPEVVRRSRSGTDWAYAPVKIPGDWYGRPAFWDRYNEDVDEKRLAERYGDLRDWHRRLEAIFTRNAVDHQIATYFYVTNWTYHRLAEEHYADALVTDPKAQNRIAPWVTNKGPDVRVFLSGNSHAEQFERDLRDLWTSYPIRGFGYDVAMGDVKYRGPAVAVSPGRAWDDEGEYCDVSVSIARNCDFIHRLPRRDVVPGVWANGGDHVYSIAVRTDAVGIEQARYQLPGLDATAKYMRYILGAKGIQLFAGDSRDRTADFYDAATASPAEVLAMYRRIHLAAMQFCLKWGVLPCADLALGWQDAWELLDLADREVFTQPWQLLPAATVDAGADLARYGTGDRSRFVVLNPRGSELRATLTIDSTAVGAHLLYACADGTETLNGVTAERVTVALDLTPGAVVVLLPVAVAPAAVPGQYRVARQQDPEDGLRLTLPAPGYEPLIPDGYAPVADDPRHFSPTLFVSSERALRAFFAFCPGGLTKPTAPYGPAPTIVVPQGAALAERKAAAAIQEFFRFYTEEVQQRQPRLVLQIVDQPAKPMIAVRTGTVAAVELSADGSQLAIQAPAGQLLPVAHRLLRLLEVDYPFYGQISRWVHQRPQETAVRTRAGLAGGMVLRDGTIVRTPLGAWLFNPTGKGPAYGQPWTP